MIDLKNKRGITLIALVITVILIMILAGVGIRTLNGENGILKNAISAKQNTDNAEIREKLELAYLSAVSKGKGNYTKQSLEKELKEEFGDNYNIEDSDNYNWVISSKGQSITIPAGEIEQPRNYTIVFNENSGEGTTENQTISYNEETNLLENKFTKTGYKFKEWNTKADGSGEKYTDKQLVKNLGNIVLYAQWREITKSSLKSGQNVKNQMKALAGNLNNIIYIKKADSIVDEYKKSNNIISEGTIQTYIWFENSTIYYFSDADEIYLNANCYQHFSGMEKLKEIDINFKTDNVTNMNQMFYNCKALTSIDLSSFNTKKVTNMASMFGNCTTLTELDLESFNTGKVTAMDNMFNGSSNLEKLNVTSFDTSSLKTMSRMFSSTKKIKELDVSSFNTSNVTNMEKMFDNMHELTTIYASSNFVTTKVTNGNGMFNYDAKLVGGNGTAFNSSNAGKTYAVIDREGTPGYFTDIANKY